MTAAITILYEDARGQTKGFGLHALVKACVYDAIDGDRHRVEGMLNDARPLKGVQNVLHACREDIDLIAADGRSVIAVIDNDAIRQHLKLPRTASNAQVEQAIKKGSRAPDRLHVILIEQNTESVLEAAAACDPSIEATRIERAVKHKDPLERDAILTELPRERARPARDCVLGKMPSLRALVDLLGGLLRPDAPRPTLASPGGAEPRQTKRRRKPGCDVRVMAIDDYSVIPQAATGGPIHPANGLVIGEVHDCGDVRLSNARVDIDQPATVVTYFTSNEDHPLPDLAANATGILGMYAAVNVGAGPVRVGAVGRAGGQLRTIGFTRAQVFPGSVSLVTFHGPLPSQVP